MFLQCTNCNRNLENKSCLWFDLEKRICKCCDCIGYEREIISCKRIKCPLHKYIEFDFIVVTDGEQDSVNNNVGLNEFDVNETKSESVEECSYDENSNLCYKCHKELFDFVYLNAKLSKIPYKDTEEQIKTKVKLKFCLECWDEINKVSKIKF